ncbi:MAG: hypothetical protein GXO88_13190 [Chlorobi bacterium]|nr:hypothetical protein [Chlorobiota bacterium]
MSLIYRKARSFVLLLSGIAAVSLGNTLDGYSTLFGVSLVVSALIGILHLFIYFDKPMNEKVLMELFLDGFAGIIIFTYSMSDESFFLTVFSFWSFIYGLFYLSSGLIDKSNKDYISQYTIMGIIMMIFGFMPLHFNQESMGLEIYAIGFALIIYSCSNLFLMYRRKRDVY